MDYSILARLSPGSVRPLLSRSCWGSPSSNYSILCSTLSPLISKNSSTVIPLRRWLYARSIALSLTGLRGGMYVNEYHTYIMTPIAKKTNGIDNRLSVFTISSFQSSQFLKSPSILKITSSTVRPVLHLKCCCSQASSKSFEGGGIYIRQYHPYKQPTPIINMIIAGIPLYRFITSPFLSPNIWLLARSVKYFINALMHERDY